MRSTAARQLTRSLPTLAKQVKVATPLGGRPAAKRFEVVPILGRQLPALKPIFVSLPKFKGLGPHLARVVMARLQLAKSETLQSLSEARLEQLSLLLSSPEAYPIVDRPVRLPSNVVLPKDDSATSEPAPKMDDPLEGLLLDNEMTRKVRRDIQKMFRLGLRRGIRHAKGLPLRKRRFSHNGMTARRLNQLERVN